MKKTILFGASDCCRRWLQYSSDNYNVIGIADNDCRKVNTSLFGHNIIDPKLISEYDFDVILITLDDWAENGIENITSIYNQLLSMGIEDKKIELQHIEYLPDNSRILFLRHLSDEFSRYNIIGAVAECGVFRGAFAGYMNEYFPDRTLYLFDTFEGFIKSDMLAESTAEAKQWLERDREVLSTGNEFIVRLRCANRSNVVIRKGAVPDSLQGLESETFSFVNLDMDLHVPQLTALRFFAPRMTRGGVILLHDYFWKWTPGVRQAVDDFTAEFNFTRLPIGDNSSIALLIR